MSPHSGLCGLLDLATTGFHPWQQHAVPSGLLSPKGGCYKHLSQKKFNLAAKGDYGLFSPNNALKQHRPFFGEAEKLRMLVGQSCVWEVFCVVVILVQRHQADRPKRDHA